MKSGFVGLLLYVYTVFSVWSSLWVKAHDLIFVSNRPISL